MHGRATITVMIALAFLVSAFAITPGGPVMYASAADYEYGYFETRGPSADNSSFYRVSPLPSTPHASYGAQVDEDGISQPVWYSQDAVFWLECSDYSNESSLGSAEYGDFYTIPENATIIEVWIIASFLLYRPSGNLYLDTGEQEYYNSTYVSAGYGGTFWNVTDLQDWTHDLLTDYETLIAFTMYGDAYIPYVCEYLGFWKIVWEGWAEGEASGSPPVDDPEDGGYDMGYDIAYTNIPGLLGFIGFAGIIAVPAFGIWVARNGESESAIALFVKMLTAWTFCFALFMYSVAG